MNREQLPAGYFGPTGDNEVEIVSTKDDPSGYRLSKLLGFIGRSIGKISWSWKRQFDTADEEVVLIQGKRDGRREGNPYDLSGEIYIGVRNGDIADADAGMIEVATIRHDSVTFHVPVNIAPSEPVPTPTPFKMVSQDGRYELIIQNDGNFVVYDLTGDASHGPRAIWSAFTGRIR